MTRKEVIERTLHGEHFCCKKNYWKIKKIFYHQSEIFLSWFFFLNCWNEGRRWKILRNLVFFVKKSQFLGQIWPPKMGVFREKRDFLKLKTQLAADTIPPIYIVFKMPPKTAPRRAPASAPAHPAFPTRFCREKKIFFIIFCSWVFRTIFLFFFCFFFVKIFYKIFMRDFDK